MAKKGTKLPTLHRGLRDTVDTYYQAQKLRIAMTNRLSAAEREDELDPDWKATLKRRAQQMQELENDMAGDIKIAVKTEPIWDAFLKDVKGCGPAMAGVVISRYVDPARWDTVSKMWAYAGLHVINTCPACGADRAANVECLDDGRLVCLHCYKSVQEKNEFVGRAPGRRKGQRASWNPFLKTKLIGVLGPAMLKAVRKDPKTGEPVRHKYAEIYYAMRDRLRERRCTLPPEKHKSGATKEDVLDNGCTNGHMHNQAIRYMIKIFIQDLYEAWRRLEKLPIRPPYKDEYLGKKHTA